MYGELDKIETLVGKTLTGVTVNNDDNTIVFTSDEGELRLFHSPECCESVTIESIVGDLADLLDTPILVAEARESKECPADAPVPEYIDSETWTFYTLRTIKGTVDIRWHGESNGYYSESADADWTPAALSRSQPQKEE